jgi:hypothetical protein
MATVDSLTITMRIERPPEATYAFAAAPENMARWATGLGASFEKRGEAWTAQSPQGPVTVRFTPRNELGVLDHHVTLPDGTTVYSPMRVIANGSGSEVLFTILRLPSMDDATFRADAETVRRDLERLKTLLES